MSRRTMSDLRAENKLLRHYRKASNLALVLNGLIKWCGLVAIFYFGYLSINSLSGRDTNAKIGFNVFGDIRFSDAVAVVLGGGGMLYGQAQRRLRKRTIQHMQGRIKLYEQTIDQKRSSSGLTPSGDTHPGDL